MSRDDGGTSSVLQRGLRLLECFSGPRTVLTIGSLVNATGIPPATVHRLLKVFCEEGFVERIGRGQYQLGVKVWQLGASVPTTRTLRDTALPYLEDLYVATRFVVHLAVVDKLSTLYLEKITGMGTVRVTSQVGRVMPLHATGPGKVLLAYGAPELLQARIEAGLPRLTNHTISTERDLRSAIATIRATGVAHSVNESSMGTASIAAPVFRGERGQIIAAISIVGANLAELQPAGLVALRTVSRAITRALEGVRVAEPA